jgi:SpoVK/Ycf46/Vps4 family AAA+-type ATPase
MNESQCWDGDVNVARQYCVKFGISKWALNPLALAAFMFQISRFCFIFSASIYDSYLASSFSIFRHRDSQVLSTAMSQSTYKKIQLIQDIILATAAPIITYFVLRHLLATKDEAPPPNQELSKRLGGILEARLEEKEKEGGLITGDVPSQLTLNTFEQTIANDVVLPSEIPVTFKDIGGLNSIISDLRESVIYPLTLPHLYSKSSSLLSAPSGVLLYGPPGCGKTMLAKALAHESGATFINLHISTLTEKWYGDSNKLVSAVFSLARKMAPSIVFIDEIDAVLGTRHSGEHEASGMVKAEFMTHWDGLASAQTGTREPQRVLILGATNRMDDIDEAILRRMPKRFSVGLPDSEQRKRILKLILKDTKIDRNPDENSRRRKLDLDHLVQISSGMSGSELREACREAAMVPVREYIHSRKARGEDVKGMNPEDIRGLRTEDFFQQAAASSDSVDDDGSDEEDEDADDGYETSPDEEGVAPKEDLYD